MVNFLFLAVLIFTTFFADLPDTERQIRTIPEGIWWAIITMTTVGYGDVVPVTLPAKIIGAGCAMMGILCMSFPVPVFVSHFNYLYNLERRECKLKPEELTFEKG